MCVKSHVVTGDKPCACKQSRVMSYRGSSYIAGEKKIAQYEHTHYTNESFRPFCRDALKRYRHHSRLPPRRNLPRHNKSNTIPPHYFILHLLHTHPFPHHFQEPPPPLLKKKDPIILFLSTRRLPSHPAHPLFYPLILKSPWTSDSESTLSLESASIALEKYA